MKQVQVFNCDDVRLVDAPEPECGPDDVLVDVADCGICGSDFGYIHMGGPMGPTGRPMPLGHEFAGRIAATGDRVTAWRVGQSVAVNPLSAANLIGNGGPDGAFAPRVRVRSADAPDTLFALPDGVSLERGALAEPLAVAFHAVRQGGHAGPGHLGEEDKPSVESLAERLSRVVSAIQSSIRRRMSPKWTRLCKAFMTFSPVGDV